MLLASALGVALGLHLMLYAFGFSRLSNDEAARVLMALELTPGNALEPLVWPPLHRILLGVALALHEDVVWVPRLFSVALALGTLAALLHLAWRITPDRRVLLATALMGAVTPYRLLLGSVPMADIVMLPLLMLAAERMLAWLRGAPAGAMLAACALAGLATAVRYEAWFVAVGLGLLVAWHWWRGRLPFRLMLGAGILLSAFPVFWIVNSLAWYGSLENLAVTPIMMRAIAGNDVFREALRLNPLGPNFWMDVVWNPATFLGLGALVLMARRDRAIRAFGLAFFLSLPLMAVVMAATASASMAASWRLPAIWSLLALPFGAIALVWLADWASRRSRLSSSAALALLLLPVVALPALRDIRLARAGMINWETMSWRHDRDAGRAALQELARLGGGLAVVDSLDNLDFLEVMVESGAPERFVTSADAPAPGVALYNPMAAHLRATGDTELVGRYLTDRFSLREGGNATAMAARSIRVAVVRDAQARAALDASPIAERIATWPDWTLYRLNPGAGAP